MDPLDASRRLSFDLITADLSTPDDLTALLAAHVVAPARALYGWRPPREGETDHVTGRPPARDEGVASIRIERDAESSVALFDPFIRGYVLLGRLFPQVVSRDMLEEALATPEVAFFSRSRDVARLTWGDLAWLADGVLGDGRAGRTMNGWLRWLPAEHDNSADFAAAESIAEAQNLLRAAIAPLAPAPHFRQLDIGLQAMDAERARELDRILRADAHERLVWFADSEVEYERQRDGSYAASATWFDRGVFLTRIPETVDAVVALDFAETLRTDRTSGVCALCERGLLLTAQQSARARRGLPVYHLSCHEEHRRRYVREYQRGWVAARRASIPGASS